MRYGSAVEFPRALFHEASEVKKTPKKTSKGVVK
jgi:hypothetical protein